MWNILKTPYISRNTPYVNIDPINTEHIIHFLQVEPTPFHTTTSFILLVFVSNYFVFASSTCFLLMPKKICFCVREPLSRMHHSSYSFPFPIFRVTMDLWKPYDYLRYFTLWSLNANYLKKLRGSVNKILCSCQAKNKLQTTKTICPIKQEYVHALIITKWTEITIVIIYNMQLKILKMTDRSLYRF